jgi:glycosyltransferase involved in cell wall biosynthesis
VGLSPIPFPMDFAALREPAFERRSLRASAPLSVRCPGATAEVGRRGALRGRRSGAAEDCMARVLHVHRDPSWAGFIADETRALAAGHEVEDLRFVYDAAGLAALAAGVARAELVWAWWGDVTGLAAGLAARAAGRPFVLVTGGYDVARVPEIGYGLRLHPWRRHLPPLVLGLATRIIVNSAAAEAELLEAFPVDRSRLVRLAHGVDPEQLPMGPREPAARAPLVIGCGQVAPSTLRRKGLDRLAAVARRLPEVPFEVLGPVADAPEVRAFVAASPPNLRFSGFLERAELVARMQAAAVVVQLSAHEGFGVALAEAMLAGCTPVVSDRGALPEVVGPVGEVVPWADPDAAAAAVARALAAPTPEAAHRRIAEAFPWTARRDGVLRVAAEALAAGPRPGRGPGRGGAC